MSGEINEARTGLDQILKQLAVDKEESELLDDALKDSGRLNESQPTTPRKRPSSSGNRTPRKRVKRDIVLNEYENHTSIPPQQTYIKKLFDRCVDFAKYNNNTSLYVLARAWMRNKPLENEDQATNLDKTDNLTASNGTVYNLPVPDPMDPDEPPLAIPEPLQRPLNGQLELDGLSEPPRGEDLLSEHMTRWKEVRRRWKQASHNNQRRYSKSIRTIRELFNQQL